MHDGTFPVADCARCRRTVLAAVDFDTAGLERRRCVHCDAELDPAALRWVDESALGDAGYATWTEAESCGRPDCGGGRCGR